MCTTTRPIGCALYDLFSLQATFRHPIKWAAPDFYDPAALDKVHPSAKVAGATIRLSHSFQEMRRVFDVCHGCRRCFNLCQSFPTLFDMIDNSPSGELNSVDSSDFKKVRHRYIQRLSTLRLTAFSRRLRTNAHSATCASSTSVLMCRRCGSFNDRAFADVHIHRPIRLTSTFPTSYYATEHLAQGATPPLPLRCRVTLPFTANISFAVLKLACPVSKTRTSLQPRIVSVQLGP
jgi:hypothetical protein